MTVQRIEVINHYKSWVKFALALVLFLCALFLWTINANATTIFYAICPSNTSDSLVSFDLESRQVTDSLALTYNGGAPQFQTNSIAFSPTGQLYGWSASHPDGRGWGQLYTIDTTSGNISMVGSPQGAPYWVNGLSFDSSGDLFGLAWNLHTIDPTSGVRTAVSNVQIGQGHRGLAIDFRTDALYAWTGLANVQDQLLAIDKITGATTSIPLTYHDSSLFDAAYPMVGVEFDPETGQLITLRNGSEIYSTDISTGQVSYLGPVTFEDNTVLRSTSLAAQWVATPVPEPSSFLLIGSGLAGLAGFFRRHGKG